MYRSTHSKDSCSIQLQTTERNWQGRVEREMPGSPWPWKPNPVCTSVSRIRQPVPGSEDAACAQWVVIYSFYDIIGILPPENFLEWSLDFLLQNFFGQKGVVGWKKKLLLDVKTWGGILLFSTSALSCGACPQQKSSCSHCQSVITFWLKVKLWYRIRE